MKPSITQVLHLYQKKKKTTEERKGGVGEKMNEEARHPCKEIMTVSLLELRVVLGSDGNPARTRLCV